MFRFIHLSVNINILVPGSAAVSAVGYFKTIPTTPPATTETVLNGVASRLITSVITTPQRLTLTRRDLSGGARVFYNCAAPTGVSPDDINQGILYAINGAAITTALEFSGIVQFRGRSNPTVD